MDQQANEQAQAASTQSTSPNAEPASQIKSVGRNVVLPSNALGRIKNEARERGKKEAWNELEAQAKAAGYTSLAEAIGALKGVASTRQPEQRQPKQQKNRNQETNSEPRQAQNKHGGGNDRNWNKERDKFSRILDQERRARQDAARKARELQRQLDATQARADLEKAAIQCGVKDIDYAVSLLLRNLEGKDAESLAQFDEAKFFEGLRGSHPYLFGETVKLANTGTAGGAPPPSPKPGQVAAAPVPGAVDPMARDEHGHLKMSQQQFHERLRKMGLNPVTA